MEIAVRKKKRKKNTFSRKIPYMLASESGILYYHLIIKAIY